MKTISLKNSLFKRFTPCAERKGLGPMRESQEWGYSNKLLMLIAHMYSVDHKKRAPRAKKAEAAK